MYNHTYMYVSESHEIVEEKCTHTPHNVQVWHTCTIFISLTMWLVIHRIPHTYIYVTHRILILWELAMYSSMPMQLGSKPASGWLFTGSRLHVWLRRGRACMWGIGQYTDVNYIPALPGDTPWACQWPVCSTDHWLHGICITYWLSPCTYQWLCGICLLILWDFQWLCDIHIASVYYTLGIYTQ